MIWRIQFKNQKKHSKYKSPENFKLNNEIIFSILFICLNLIMKVSVKIIPKKEGILIIKGLKWKLFKIPVAFEFEFKGKIIKKTQERC